MDKASVSQPAVSSRNRCLDFFKGVSALCVVFGHISFPGRFGKCISAIGSCGILLFFLISGFHAYGDRETMKPKLLKRFRRNLFITLIAAVVYAAAAAVEYYISNRTLHGFLRPFSQGKFYLRLLLLGDLEPIHGDPLWFMFALLYAYLIFWLMYQLRLQKYAKYAMPLFVMLRIVLESYKYAVDGDWRICSNVLVAALPMMLLGYCLAERKETLLKIPVWLSAGCCILSLICVFLLVIYDPFRYNISQIFKILTAVSAMIFAMKKPALRIFPPLSALGGAYSLHVYLWHMPVIVILYLICERHTLPDRFYAWYLPLIAAAVSVLLAVMIVAVQTMLKKCRRPKEPSRSSV